MIEERKSKIALVLLVLGVLMIVPREPVAVRAQLVGKVCIADIATTFCPTSPTIVSGTVGTPLNVAVNIQGSDVMNGFDIFVKSDTATVQPIGVNMTGTVLGTNTLAFADCVEFVGSGCGTLLNGPGIVRFALVALGTVVLAPATGRLFSIGYRVLQNSTGINVGFQTGCTGGSVPSGLCILVVNAGVAVPETAQESATPGIGDFSLSGDQLITIPRGTEASGLVNVLSQGGFFGGITLSTTISPVRKDGPVAVLSTSLVFILPGTSSTVRLLISTSLRTHPGNYNVIITATSGSKTHSMTVVITVPRR
ncbi:MAG TPA: hypothetical protein VGS11_06330 [Candidatus Bathyarchaeia archaeon]|nr:hypothetical protein [Candidatus Bathyarchaeia archaeon]